MTWSLVDEQCSGNSQTEVSVWQALGTPTVDQVVVATLSSSIGKSVIAVTRYSGVKTSSAVTGVVSGNTNGIDGLCSGGSNTASYAFNVTTTASGSRSTAMGNNTDASGYSATAMGGGTTASGYNATAMGNGTTASHDYSTAMGLNTTASGFASTTMGLLQRVAGLPQKERGPLR